MAEEQDKLKITADMFKLEVVEGNIPHRTKIGTTPYTKLLDFADKAPNKWCMVANPGDTTLVKNLYNSIRLYLKRHELTSKYEVCTRLGIVYLKRISSEPAPQ